MKRTLQLGVISAVNIGISFLFQWYVLTRLGPGIETDALFAGMTLPQLVLTVISSSLMHVLVPLLAGENEDKQRHDAWAFLVLIGGLFGVLATILYVSAPWWISLTLPGFSSVGKALTVELTRIQLVGMVFSAINGVQWAAYHARQKFIRAEITPVLSSTVGLVLLMWALPRYGVIAAAWISTLRMGMQTLLLVPGMGSPVWPDLHTATIAAAWNRIKPLLLGTAYYKTDPLIDRFMLSTASTGSLTLYYFAQQIYGALNQIINKAIAAPLVPVFAMYHKAGDTENFWSLFNRKLMQMVVVGILGVCVLVFLGKPLLSLLVGHGHFKTGNIKPLWTIMILMSGQFIISNIGVVMTSMFYSIGDTRSPTLSGAVAYTLGIPVKVLMFFMFGINGLAIGVSIYFLISLLFMALQVKRVKHAYKAA